MQSIRQRGLSRYAIEPKEFVRIAALIASIELSISGLGSQHVGGTTSFTQQSKTRASGELLLYRAVSRAEVVPEKCVDFAESTRYDITLSAHPLCP